MTGVSVWGPYEVRVPGRYFPILTHIDGVRTGLQIHPLEVEGTGQGAGPDIRQWLAASLVHLKKLRIIRLKKRIMMKPGRSGGIPSPLARGCGTSTMEAAALSAGLFCGDRYRVLEARTPAAQFSTTAIAEYVLDNPGLPEQTRLDKDFGQPSVTLYRDARFHIDVLFWLAGSTAIHQHQFAGAFTLLAGSSLHGQYRFEPEREVLPDFRLGRISLRYEYLATGSVRPIRPGPEFIHSPLPTPRDARSCTLVVRTPDYKGAKRKWNISRHLWSWIRPTNSGGYKQAVDLLELCSKPTGRDICHGAAPLSRRNHVARRLPGPAAGKGAWRGRRSHLLCPVICYPAGTGAALASPILESIEEDWRRRVLIAERKKVIDEDRRFLLALMLHLPDEELIHRLIRQKYRDSDPGQLMEKWLNETI